MNELKVGILALVTLASVIFMSIKITSNQSGFGDYIKYKTIIRDHLKSRREDSGLVEPILSHSTEKSVVKHNKMTTISAEVLHFASA